MLQKFAPKQQLLLLREIAGAFQTTEQQSKWNSEVPDKCVFCGEDGDDRQHRSLRCLAFTEAREKHSDIVDELIQDDPDFVEMPVIFMHPHYEFHDAMLHSMPMPVVAQQTIDTLKSLQQPCLTFYTDGCCMYPDCVDTSYSAFSVVADLAVDDQQRRQQAAILETTGKMPSTLHTIIVGRTNGRQHIHRAEAFAVLCLFEHFDNFVAYTDSAVAISMVEKCRRAQSMEELLQHDDADILQRFFLAMAPTKRLSKIKAHQQTHDIQDMLMKYHVLGNAAADTAAKEACTRLFPEIVNQFEEFHQDQQNQRKKLLKFFALNIDLQNARAKAVANRQPQQIESVSSATDIRSMFMDWKVEEPWSFPEQIDDEELHFSVWGFQWAVALLEWLQSCRWPAQPKDGDPGISWAEIAVCLAMQQGHWLPVKRTHGTRELIMQPIHCTDMEDLQLTLGEQSNNAYNLMCQLQGLIVQPVMPDFCRYGKCQSLYIQGYHAWTTGLSVRPQFPQQSQVYELMHGFLATRRANLESLPPVNLCFVDERWPEDMEETDFHERTRKSRLAMIKVRKRRKNLGL